MMSPLGSLRLHPDFPMNPELGAGCGLRAGEVVRLRAGDIDREQMIIRVVQSKGRKDRHVMLLPEILDLLRQ
jgi:integrase